MHRNEIDDGIAAYKYIYLCVFTIGYSKAYENGVLWLGPHNDAYTLALSIGAHRFHLKRKSYYRR